MPSPPLPGESAASTPFSAARTGLSTEITRTTTGSATCSSRRGPGTKGKQALVLGPVERPSPSMRCWPMLAPRETIGISRNGPNNYENLDRHADAQLIVNATPWGCTPTLGYPRWIWIGFPPAKAYSI